MNPEVGKVIKNNRFLFIIKILVSCILSGIVLVIPFFYSYAVEEITGGNTNQAFLLATFLLIFTIVYYIWEMVNDYVYEKLYYKLSLRLTKIGLEFTEKNSIYSLSRIPLGVCDSIMTSDINVVADCSASLPLAMM